MPECTNSHFITSIYRMCIHLVLLLFWAYISEVLHFIKYMIYMNMWL